MSNTVLKSVISPIEQIIEDAKMGKSERMKEI